MNTMFKVLAILLFMVGVFFNGYADDTQELENIYNTQNPQQYF